MTLRAKEWDMAITPSLLITGEAGSGKSHLLADACSHQLEKKRPVVLLLGGQLSDAEIWRQVSNQLGLPADYTRDQLLGALDAAGEAAVVRDNDLPAALKHLEGKMLSADHDLGFTNEASSDDFLGEFGWRVDKGEEWTTEWAQKWIDKPTPNWVTAPVEGTCPTFELRQEASGYNFSLVQNLSVILPCPWLMQDLNMSLKDGRDLIYTDMNGSIVFKDPSASREGPSAGLVDRDAFMRLLTKKKLAPIWVIGGGKELHSDRNDIFGHRWFTSTWSLEDGTFRRRSHVAEVTDRRDPEDSY